MERREIDMVSELIDRLEFAVKYLDHADVLAINFAFPVETVANACYETIERGKQFLLAQKAKGVKA